MNSARLHEVRSPAFKVIYMIDWIKKFFVVKEKEKKPKCDICALGAKYHMLVEFQTMELKELENKILIKICDGCYEEVYERYNPERKPPPIQSGVFESQLRTRKDKKKDL